ncbi:MAG: hypothetical protein ACYDEB_10520 [Dehalococcoidia bacterium]
MKLRKNLAAKIGALAASLLALGATLVLVQRNPPPPASASAPQPASANASAPPPTYADGSGADASQTYYTQAPPVDTRTSAS